MSKGFRLMLSVFVAFLCLSILHIWLNIGFQKLNFIGRQQTKSSLRVGFLPVT